MAQKIFWKGDTVRHPTFGDRKVVEGNNIGLRGTQSGPVYLDNGRPIGYAASPDDLTLIEPVRHRMWCVHGGDNVRALMAGNDVA